VPAVDPETAADIVVESGARTAKVKIGEPGQAEATDLSRIESVIDALGPGGQVRVDVNGSWDLETATARLERMSGYHLEYCEQPVMGLDEMIELRRRVGVPLAADELVRQGPGPERVVEAGAADVIILKVQPMGGVARVLDLARDIGLPVVVSSALETSIGMYGGLLAGSLIDSPYAFGLGTVSLLAGDPTTEPLLPEGGQLMVRRPEPDPELLARWRPPADVSAALLHRLEAASGLIG
jgi:O-succinylbenzoate synthase